MSNVQEQSKSQPRPGQEKLSASVTYIPGDGDPVRTVWNGVEFRANVPVDIPLTKTVLAPMRKEHYLADGTLQSRGVETKVSMVDLARGNPSFSVDGVQAARKSGAARLPTDNDQYRGYALRWVRETTTVQALDQRWDGEAALREKCGCDDKDMAYLMPFIEARRSQMREAA